MSVARILSASGLLRPDKAVGGNATAPHPKTQPGQRQSLVVVYIVVAALALVPGLALKFGFTFAGQPALAAYLERLSGALADIKFGSGLRFWLGVTGATMMALLLLYPLRKVLFKARAPGSVGGWFHVHMLFGLIGPVLILYHCNFELGGFNANVALWTMLAVAVSGIAGYFVYSRVSRDFYVAIERARQLRQLLIASLPGVEESPSWKDQLTRDFEAFETEALTPRQGVISSLRTRVRVEQLRRPIVHNVAAYINEYANAKSFDRAAYVKLRTTTGRHLGVYFALARSSASQSVREQLWSRWRLFHLPMFLIMVAAVALHVIAVWGMDDPAGASGADATEPSQSAVAEAVSRPADDKDPIGTLLANDASGRPSSVRAPAAVKSASQVNSGATNKPDGTAVAGLPSQFAATSGAVPAGPKAPTADPPRLVGAPKLVTSRARPSNAAAQSVPVAQIQSSPPQPGSRGSLPQSRPPISAAAFDEPPARPVRVAESLAATAKPIKPAAAANPDPSSNASSNPSSKEAITELERRLDSRPMGLGMTVDSAAAMSTGLGGPGLSTLAEQIPFMKARMAAQQFSHSEMETGFALTGKHLKAECTSCHTAPLRDVRQSVARTCVACHKKDDVHKGRRPQCVDCHTTNRWTQILRRK